MVLCYSSPEKLITKGPRDLPGGDLPGGPVVKTSPSSARVAGLIPGQGASLVAQTESAYNVAMKVSSPVFLMMYSAYKLNKQGNNIQP